MRVYACVLYDVRTCTAAQKQRGGGGGVCVGGEHERTFVRLLAVSVMLQTYTCRVASAADASLRIREMCAHDPRCASNVTLGPAGGLQCVEWWSGR